jgi:hypothetical protein
MATGPILQLIQPVVDGIPDPAWFIQYASGYLQWAQNPQAVLCARLGIAAEVTPMGAEQYNRLMSMATAGWNPALGAIPGVTPTSAKASAAIASTKAGPDLPPAT